MHPLVPSFIIEQYQSGTLAGQFPAVGLFVDISGFSGMTDALMAHGQHGAEVLAELMRAVMDPIIESIFAQGGFVCASAGDALTALFPLDPDPADTALRALAAANRIQVHMARQSVFETTYQAFQVSAKVGLASGTARWGIILSQDNRRAVYYFQGAAVEGSAAAEHHARAGDVILAPGLLTLLEGWVEAVPVEDHFRLLRVTGDLPAPRATPTPAIDLATAVLFFPEPLIRQELSGEFRQVVNLFVSLPSVRTENQLHIFMKSLFALQEKYGGLLQHIDFGDKGTNLLMFWGAPRAYENDIERALGFILDLQTLTSIPISAGVSYRVAHAGFIGGRLHEEYTCYGRGVNLAARFMTSAVRNEIWVDEPAAQRAGGFITEFLGEKRFKGFATPQKVYTLHERGEEAHPFFHGVMTGRDAELNHLRDFVRPVFHRQYAGLLVVRGEPGIGKSRLVHELLHNLEQEGQPFQSFLAQTDEILRQPLNPFVYWLRRYFDISDAQGESRNKRSFNRSLDDLIAATHNRKLADELDRTRSFLGALLGLHWPDSLYEQLDASVRYQNTQVALASLIQAASRQAPLIFFLEDMHWLDSDSTAFLTYLLRLLSLPGGPTWPIAIIATSRDEPAQLSPAGAPPAQVLHLQGLSPDSLFSLAGGLLDAPPSQELLDLLATRAEGIPFYAEQTLHYLRDEGLLVREPDCWTITQARLESLPVDVNTLLVARLDHLSLKVKDAVQTAAVLGREFEVHLLSLMLGFQAQTVPPEVSVAEREAIWTALSEIRYIFNHTLLREAAYQMQVHARRKALHALAFAAYEQLYQEDLSAHYEALAYHADHAGLTDQAHRYLRLAGEAAAGAYANDSALAHFTRALELTPPEDLESLYALRKLRQGIYNLQGNQSANLDEINRLAEIAGQLGSVGKQADMLLQRSRLLNNQGQYEASEEAARQAKALAYQTQNIELQLYSHIELGFVMGRLSQYTEAFQEMEPKLELARASRLYEHEARLLYQLGVTENLSGNFVRSQGYFQQCLEAYRLTSNRLGEGLALNNLGISYWKQGNLAAAGEKLEQSLSIMREIGARSNEVYPIANIASIFHHQRRYAEAISYGQQALGLARELNQPYVEARAQGNLGLAFQATGDVALALQAYEQALAIAQATGDHQGEALGLENIAWVYIYLGDLQAAGLYLEKGFQLCQEIGDREIEAEIEKDRAIQQLWLGSLEQALIHCERALAIIQQMEIVNGMEAYLMLHGGINNLQGEIHLQHNQIERAAASYQEAHKILIEAGRPAMEAVAGLIQVDLARGDISQAAGRAAEILAFLENDTVADAVDPAGIYLACYQALQAAGDARCTTVLAQGHNLMQSRAEFLTDHQRRTYLENVPSNKALCILWNNEQSG